MRVSHRFILLGIFVFIGYLTLSRPANALPPDTPVAAPLSLASHEHLTLISSVQLNTVWESGGREILHQIGGDDFQSYYRCNPTIQVIQNPMPIAHLQSCNKMVFSSGLLGLVEDPSEFAFVIAHEIAHEMLGHLGDEHTARHGHHWSLHEEIEADLLALKLLRQGGYQDNRAAKLLERLENFGSNAGTKLAVIYPTLQARRIRMVTELRK